MWNNSKYEISVIIRIEMKRGNGRGCGTINDNLYEESRTDFHMCSKEVSHMGLFVTIFPLDQNASLALLHFMFVL